MECDPEIGNQVVRLPGFYNDIVDICLYAPPEMVSENVEHALLIGSSSVSEAEGHRNVAIHAERCDKRSRELVGLFHLHLVVTGVSIKKGQKFTPRSRIYNLINPWQSKRNLRTCFV